MTQSSLAYEEVAALYQKKRSQGLVRARLVVSPTGEATSERICEEVLALENAVQAGAFKPLVFDDKRSA